jgi:hypothetical protein
MNNYSEKFLVARHLAGTVRRLEACSPKAGETPALLFKISGWAEGP